MGPWWVQLFLLLLLWIQQWSPKWSDDFLSLPKTRLIFLIRVLIIADTWWKAKLSLSSVPTPSLGYFLPLSALLYLCISVPLPCLSMHKLPFSKECLATPSQTFPSGRIHFLLGKIPVFYTIIIAFFPSIIVMCLYFTSFVGHNSIHVHLYPLKLAQSLLYSKCSMSVQLKMGQRQIELFQWSSSLFVPGLTLKLSLLFCSRDLCS